MQTGSTELNINEQDHLINAPTFGVDFDCDVVIFIDMIITCKKPTENSDLLALLNRQVHRHSHTCRKKSKNVCRFNYPQPPMRSTKIVYRLDTDNMNNDELKQCKDAWQFIKKHLNDMKDGEDITFDQLLINLKLTEQNYLVAIRSSLKMPTIFLKRKPNKLRINNIMLHALVHGVRIWIFNLYLMCMRVQYILYHILSKAQKGMSE